MNIWDFPEFCGLSLGMNSPRSRWMYLPVSRTVSGSDKFIVRTFLIIRAEVITGGHLSYNVYVDSKNPFAIPLSGVMVPFPSFSPLVEP